MSGSFLLVAGALAGVVALILILGWALRPWAPVRPAGAGKCLAARETLVLDTRRRLHLIQVGPRAVVLLTGGERDVVIGWLDGAPGA